MSGGRLKTELRITAGALRGRPVPVPRNEVRPTSERARQAYFNIIGDRIHGARFLDLFAGSGIFSFEAISRGAASAVAVDSSKRNVMQIAAVAGRFGVSIETIESDVFRAAGRLTGAFDLAYADPPYDFGQYDELLQLLEGLAFSDKGVVAVEHRRRSSPFTVEPRRLALWRRAEYGEVWITFFTTGEGTGAAKAEAEKRETEWN